MAGILGALGVDNGFTNWWDQHRNAITNFGAGLANPQPGLGNATAGLAQGAQQDSAYAIQQKAEKDRLDNINKTASWLKQNYPQFAALPPEQGFQLAAQLQAKREASSTQADPSDVATYKFYANQELQGGRQPKSFEDWQTGMRTGVKGSLGNTLPFLDPKTQQLHPIQVFSDGSRQDLVTGAPPDPSLIYSPYDLAAAKGGGAGDAANAVAARNALPAATQAFDMANKAADDLLNNTQGMADQFGKTLGVFPNQLTPDVWPLTQPGSPMSLFRTQLKQGQGNAFLQARNVLKGAGQVTDYEGAKAESAYSRMALAAQNNNQEEFITAVQDFKQAVAEGFQKLKQAAAGDYAAGNVPGLQGGQPQTSGGDLSGMSDVDLLNALNN